MVSKNSLKILLIILILIISMIKTSQISYASITKESKGIISVKNIEEGVNVYLYKIANLEYDYIQNSPKDDGYKWEDSIQNWIDINYAQYSNTKNFYNEIKSNTKESQDFYDDLTSAIKNSTIEIDKYKQKQAEGESVYPVSEDKLTGNVKFTEVDMGSYLIIIENGYMVYNTSIAHVIPSFNTNTNKWEIKEQEVVIKASKPSISKFITGEQKKADNFGTNDKIFYTIKADIPKYLEKSLSKKYIISDKLDKSFTLDRESIIVYGYKNKNEAISIKGYDITWETTRPNSSEKVDFLIDFDYDLIEQYEFIEIIYIVTLNQDSNLILGAEGNNNQAFLDYSNNPYSISKFQTQITDKIPSYSYGIEITSVDKNDVNKVLPKSEFKLYGIDEKELYFKQGNDGVYYLSDSQKQNTTNTLIADENGKLHLYGLDEGTYNLKTTKTPEGYNVSSKIHEIKILDSNVDGALDDEESNEGIYKLIITNTSGFELPITGSKELVILLVLGTILTITGLVILIYRKR